MSGKDFERGNVESQLCRVEIDTAASEVLDIRSAVSDALRLCQDLPFFLGENHDGGKTISIDEFDENNGKRKLYKFSISSSKKGFSFKLKFPELDLLQDEIDTLVSMITDKFRPNSELNYTISYVDDCFVFSYEGSLKKLDSVQFSSVFYEFKIILAFIIDTLKANGKFNLNDYSLNSVLINRINGREKFDKGELDEEIMHLNGGDDSSSKDFELMPVDEDEILNYPTLETVVLPEDLKKSVMRYVSILTDNDEKRREKWNGLELSNLIFYGLPGTGKTMLVKAVARELHSKNVGYEYVEISASDLLSHWYGKSEKRIAQFFDQLREQAPIIVFFDEADDLFMDRKKQDNAFRGTTSAFLREITSHKNKGIVLVAATNDVESIDPAFKRPGRFSKHFEFKLPNKENFKTILNLYLSRLPIQIEFGLDAVFELLSPYVGRWSGADINGFVQFLHEVIYAREIETNTDFDILTFADLKLYLDAYLNFRSKETKKSLVGFTRN